MKKVLIIAYFFAPLSGAGAFRPLKLIKYLPLYGWESIVLTVKNPDWHYAYDDQLLNEIPPQARVVRSFMLRSAFFYRFLNPLRVRRFDLMLRRYMVHPDEQIGWLPFAVQKAISIIKNNHIDAIYSTSGPLTSHLIAYRLCKRFGIPWMADFRDEWFENPDLPLPTGFHRRLHYHLEGMIVKKASQVITAAPIFGRLLSKHCPNEPKFETITMGFDPDDYTGRHDQPHQRNEKFTLTFSGLFYGSFRPDPLLKAVNNLIAEGKIQNQTVCFRFIGANTPQDLREPDRYGICEFTGFVPHERALHLAGQSDVLLLLLSRERGKDVIPSKTFEYMALKKPVLAIVPSDGNAAKIIRETGIGLVADFENMSDIADAFFRMYKQWANGSLSSIPNADEIEKYSYINLSGRFASLLDQIAKKPPQEDS